MSPTRQSKRLQGAVEAAVKQVTKKAKTETAKKPASKKAKAEAVSAAKAEPAQGKSNKADDAQAAWGALFSNKASPAKIAPGLLQPMAASPLSDEMKTRIKEYAAFEGVSSEKAKASNTKVVAWNVNGLRAVLKREDGVHLRAFVAQEDPDIFCISETKIGAEDLQKVRTTHVVVPSWRLTQCGCSWRTVCRTTSISTGRARARKVLSKHRRDAVRGVLMLRLGVYRVFWHGHLQQGQAAECEAGHHRGRRQAGR